MIVPQNGGASESKKRSGERIAERIPDKKFRKQRCLEDRCSSQRVVYVHGCCSGIARNQVPIMARLTSKYWYGRKFSQVGGPHGTRKPTSYFVDRTAGG